MLFPNLALIGAWFLRGMGIFFLSGIMLLYVAGPAAPLFVVAWQYLGPRDLPSLVESSRVITLGIIIKVAANYSGIDSGGSPCCFRTLFQVDVVEYVKGSGPNTIYVSDGVFPSGYPAISAGQRYVLFLQNDYRCAPSPPSPPCVLPPTPLHKTYYPTGGPQGKFLVVNNQVYGYKTLFPETSDFLPVDASGVSLDEFLSQIRNVSLMNETLPVITLVAAIAIIVVGADLHLVWDRKRRVSRPP